MKQRPSQLNAVTIELCKRLAAAAPEVECIADVDAAAQETVHTAGAGDDDVEVDAVSGDIASIALYVCSMHLMHMAHTALCLELASAALDCVAAWRPAGAVSASSDRSVIHKCLAATAALGGSVVRGQPVELALSERLVVLLLELLATLLDHRVAATASASAKAAAEAVAVFEAWHLDGCIHALTVCPALVAMLKEEEADEERSASRVTAPQREFLQRARSTLVAEVCQRRTSLPEQSVRFWLSRLCEPTLLHYCGEDHPLRALLAELVPLEGEEPLMDRAAAAALRDVAFALRCTEGGGGSCR